MPPLRLIAALFVMLGTALAVPPASAYHEPVSLLADYRFDDSLESAPVPGSSPPALTNIGPGNAFAWEPVGPTPNRVLTFPAGNGVHLPTSMLHDGLDYTVVVEFRLADLGTAAADDYRRVLNFEDPSASPGASDYGLYVRDGKLDFYDAAGDHEHPSSAPFTPNQYVEVAFVRADNFLHDDTFGDDQVVGYVNGVHQFTATDNAGVAFLMNGGGGIWFFKDNSVGVGPNEHSAGAVSRIRFYHGSMQLSDVQAVAAQNDPPPPDGDGDGVYDHLDNCAAAGNADQSDLDTDGQGNACDADDDGDGVADTSDKCPAVADAAQGDLDADGQGDACDSDGDGDGVADATDKCPATADPGQDDLDGDGEGDACDSDDDGDGLGDAADNCPVVNNAADLDTDGDGHGNACDSDDDADQVADAADTCPLTRSADQIDTDGDGAGDPCDPDDDGDGVLDAADPCPLVARAGANGCPAAQVRRAGKPRARRAGKRRIRVVSGFRVVCPVSPLTCRASGTVTRAKGKKRPLGRVRLTLQPAANRKISIRLTKKGTRALRRARRMRVRITVAATGPDGRRVSTTRRARLRAPR